MASYMMENVSCGSASYLFACFGSDCICSPETVFGRINDDSLIPSLISLLETEFGDQGNPSFHAQLVTDTEEADQVLLDEAIDELAIYDDPDPGVYDPPPSRQTMLRASYAQRAERWAEMLRSRKVETACSNNGSLSLLRMRKLHQCLVKIDAGIMSLGGRLLRLRQADPHSLISEPTRKGASFDQVREVQDQIEKWTSPILEAAREAEESCVGISTLVGTFVDEPVRWETDLRESLRHLRDLLATLPHSHGAQTDEAQIVSLGAALYAQGTRLEDGLVTLEACDAPSTTDSGRAGSPPFPTPSTKPSGTTAAADPVPSKDSEYEWARQTELVRATDQVLGQGTLSPGVLCRACGQQIETNGKRRQCSRVKVSSFLPWVARKFSLTKEEQTQVRNAIIGEISERNS